MQSNLIVYVPVIHQGYIGLIARHNAAQVCVVGSDLLSELGYHDKEIRALDPDLAASLLSLLCEVEVLINTDELQNLRGSRIIVASDEVTRVLVDRYLQGCDITWDTAFLRWDSQSVRTMTPAGFNRTSDEPRDRAYMQRAHSVAQRTSDWWRQVGAVLVKDGVVRYAKYNRHLPSEHTPYAVGDPRDFVEAGTRSELASAAHAEQQIIAAAAKDGFSLEGSSLYVTTFPCPACAKSIGLSGIRSCYFESGHSSLDGVNDMKQQGVQLILVTPS